VPFVDRNGTALINGGGTEILAGHDHIHGPGPEAVFSDVDSDILMYHCDADDGSSKLGVNLLSWDSATWPFVH
jgi:arabinan endo-1,5-alpha-L-arabinosidase